MRSIIFMILAYIIVISYIYSQMVPEQDVALKPDRLPIRQTSLADW